MITKFKLYEDNTERGSVFLFKFIKKELEKSNSIYEIVLKDESDNIMENPNENQFDFADYDNYSDNYFVYINDTRIPSGEYTDDGYMTNTLIDFYSSKFNFTTVKKEIKDLMDYDEEFSEEFYNIIAKYAKINKLELEPFETWQLEKETKKFNI